VGIGPLLEQREVLLARTSGQVVPATLQQQIPFRVETHCAIGPIQLFLNNEMAALDVFEGD
jgi:hypothetical protein